MVVVHHASSVAGEGVSPFVAVPAGVFDGGVAVFFVLSGFLIYRPFADARAAGQALPGTRAYGVRRVARLIPAYWLALSALWVVGAVDLGHNWWRFYLLLQPYSRETALGGLVPAWSLSTELAFYAFVPLWAWILRTVKPRATTLADLAACLVLYLAGFAFRSAVSAVDPAWRGLSFQWLPANIDLFAIGMAAAVLTARAPFSNPWHTTMQRITANAEVLWAAAAALLLWYLVRVGPPDLTQLTDPNGAYRGVYWQQRQFVFGLFSMLLLAPLVLAIRPDGVVRRSLRLRPVVWMGTVSYGLYLWHLPIMERAARFNGSGVSESATAILSTGGTRAFLYYLLIGLTVGCVFAVVSWTSVERPVLRGATRRWATRR